MHVIDDVWEIVDVIQNRINDSIAYDHIIFDAVYQLAILPVNREEMGLEPLSDPVDVKLAYDEIVEIISTGMEVPISKVKADMSAILKTSPVEDLRKIKNLKQTNMLH